MTQPNDSLLPCREAFIEHFLRWYSDCAQLLDGWHQDGTAWSEWDEKVRKELIELGKEATAALNTRTNHPSASQAAMVEELMKYRQVLCDCDDKRICTPHEIVDGCLGIVTKHTQPQGDRG